MTASSCLSNLMVIISATIYLILGVVLMAAAASTFFTPFGEILEPLYASSVLGGGVVIFLIAVIGLCAACDKRQRVCLLWLFTVLTFIVFCVSIGLAVAMFAYEDVLKEAAKVNLEEEVQTVTQAISGANTAVVKTLATNTFSACGANTTQTEDEYPLGFFNFTCRDSWFNVLGDTVQEKCLGPTNAVNASMGSTFYKCYEGNQFATWVSTVDLTSSTFEGVLNTPKGVFCACSSELINDYILPYLSWAKWVTIGVAVFFAMVFVACLVQICCVRGVCGKKSEEKFADMESVQMNTYPADPNNNTIEPKKKKKQQSGKFNSGGYVARP